MSPPPAPAPSRVEVRGGRAHAEIRCEWHSYGEQSLYLGDCLRTHTKMMAITTALATASMTTMRRRTMMMTLSRCLGSTAGGTPRVLNPRQVESTRRPITTRTFVNHAIPILQSCACARHHNSDICISSTFVGDACRLIVLTRPHILHTTEEWHGCGTS